MDLVHREFEELSWRMAAKYDDHDKDNITKMFSLGRGLDRFDQVFFNLDMQSFNHFFDEANTYDDRQQLLEKWLSRKEEELRRRVNLPTPELNKSD